MALPNFRLDGKVALITGAKRGIGKGIALTFAEAGADVALCSRTFAELEPVAAEIRKIGRKALPVKADVAAKTEVEHLVGTVMAEFGRIDVLVNNAVIYAPGSLTDLSEENWDNTVNTGLKGYYLVTQSVARQAMIPQKQGCIINMGSTAGIRPTGWQGAYSVIKAGGMMMTKLLAVELAPFNIRVNALAPTVVKAEGITEDLLKGFMPQLPLGRLTEVNELTSAALFLASEAASYISGHILVVDGGRINTFPRARPL
jgi:NAD(P)-dependent dehydrogenase (short-subunit alcohol dehydrogenase family)